MKEYNFCVPVSGQEFFSVEANSFEEALEKVYSEKYSAQPTLDDINWNFGLGNHDTYYELERCCTVSDINQEG